MRKRRHNRIPRHGDRSTMEPACKRGLVALLEEMKPLEEDFSEIDDPIPALEKVP